MAPRPENGRRQQGRRFAPICAARLKSCPDTKPKLLSGCKRSADLFAHSERVFEEKRLIKLSKVEKMSSGCTDALRTYVAEAKTAIEALSIQPRRPHRYPFDLIALEHIAKVVSIAESCLILLDSGRVGEAYGLSRSAVEAALSLRHITVNRDDMNSKCMEFGRYSQHVKDFWLYYAREMHPGVPDSAEVAAEVEECGLTGDPKPAREKWIDTWKTALLIHPLDQPVPAGSPVTAELIKKANYAIDYFQPSQYVHCSQVAMDWLVPEDGTPFRFSEPKPTVEYAPQAVCNILHVYLHWVVAYALWGLRIDFPVALETAFEAAFHEINDLPCPMGLGPAV
jgi:hypothetical protein